LPQANPRDHSYYLAAALNELGTAYSENGEPRTALTYFDEALTVAARLGRTPIMRRYESDRAAALADLGDTHQARHTFERICQDEHAEDHSALWETQLRLSRLDMEAGALDRAGKLLEAAAAAEASAHIVCERIRRTAFPDNYTAKATFQLDRVLAVALRTRSLKPR
jgi:tetratricopeptide (TPR) repeat protein